MRHLLALAALLLTTAARAQSGTTYQNQTIQNVRVVSLPPVTISSGSLTLANGTTVYGRNGAALASEQTLVAVSTGIAALSAQAALLSQEATQVAVSTTLAALQARAQLLATEATLISLSTTTAAIKARADLLATEATLLAVRAQTDLLTFAASRLLVNASGSSVAVYGLNGQPLATEATAASLFKAGQSAVVSTGSITAYQGGTWNIANVSTAPVTIATGSITAFQGGLWSVSGSSVAVANVAGTTLAVSVANFPASQAVTGPLTDTQLRASPVPVSGSFSATGSSVSVANVAGSTLNVAVTNFPASQTIAGAVTVTTGSITVFQGGPWSTSGSSISVANVAGSTLNVNLVNSTVSLNGIALLATAANQTTANASLSSIDTKLTSPLTVSPHGITGVVRTTVDVDSTTATNPTNVRIIAGSAQIGLVSGSSVSVSNVAGSTLNVSVTNFPDNQGVTVATGSISSFQGGVWSVGISSSGRTALVDSFGSLQVTIAASTVPVGSVAVSTSGMSTLATGAFVDLTITGTSGKAVYITRFSGGAYVGSSNARGSKIEIFYDPNGNGVGMTTLDVIFAQGSSNSFPSAFYFDGNGIKKIRLRRTSITGNGTADVWGKVEGYEL